MTSGKRVSRSKASEEAVYDLRLYVAGQNPRSLQAFANLKKICDEHLAGRYRINVIDLLVQPQLAKGDQIFAIPTLVRQLPQPVRKILGDLSNTERVLVGLDIRPEAQNHDVEYDGRDEKVNSELPGGALAAFERLLSEGQSQRYDLRLYVAGTTPRSLRAIQNITRLCEAEIPGRYDLDIIDVYQQSARASEDQIVALPTLVKDMPLPRRKLVGDLSQEIQVRKALGLPLKGTSGR